VKHVLDRIHLTKKVLIRREKHLSEFCACTGISYTDDFKISAGVAITSLGDDTNHGFIGGVCIHHITEGFPAREKA
jgi:hypothetical protein